ncbi:type IV pilus biogenesis protein PilM [Virgibacillus byunsanensis]|uniref:Type IV pilus biogenesis protein PilM n=1 Tax=Virgibacillus byunsanensis TaxID=570945 RepID=A0ABW3LJL8_9BACI
MGYLNNGRVNIVITNRLLRFTYHKNPSAEGLVTHGEVELPEGTIKDGTIVNKSALLEVIHQLVRKHKWKRKKLIFAVPDDTVVIRQLQIPISLTKEESISYVNTQIGNSFYLPFANPALDIEFLGEDEQNRNILLFAYPKEKIIAYETVFEEAGLKPIAADLTTLSVYRYYYLQQMEEKAHVLLIHWNQDALILTAFQHHKAVFTRYMTIEANTEGNEEIAKEIINEFVIEINRIIDFYHFSITKGEASINRLLLTGDFSFLNSVKETLSESVTIPIQSFEKEELQSAYIDVLGLALKRDV